MFQNITPVVKNLLIINVAIFILQYLTDSVQANEYGQLVHVPGFVTKYGSMYDFRHPDFRIWQTITYMFLHSTSGIFHLLFNMLWLFFMGPILERFLGDKKFLILYMVAGVGAGLLQIGIYYIESPDVITGYMLLGASGAVAGLMMGVAVLFPNSEIVLFPIPIPIKMKYFAMFYVAYELYNGINSASNIAHFAHLGGMLFAYGLIKIWGTQRSNFY